MRLESGFQKLSIIRSPLPTEGAVTRLAKCGPQYDATGAPPLPMKGAWHTIRSYILWQHERGTLHYDIMVTLILIFVFFSPRLINFNDKPGPPNQHRTGRTGDF